jgi:hypothetical protein
MLIHVVAAVCLHTALHTHTHTHTHTLSLSLSLSLRRSYAMLSWCLSLCVIIPTVPTVCLIPYTQQVIIERLLTRVVVLQHAFALEERESYFV